MPSIVVVGAQWGDEGKGKLVDYLASEAVAVVRYQGGNNAGHTVLVGEEKYKLHLIPSGILYKSKVCILGNGTVVDLPALCQELRGMTARGVDTSNLYVSSAAHLILPYHKVIDSRTEESKGSEQIGTTRRGIGPAYEDKVNRMGIRVGDLGDPQRFKRKLEKHRQAKAAALAGADLDWESIAREYLWCYQTLDGHVTDTGEMVDRLLAEGNRVLFEGAQGTFLDLDHGTYPYVTSSTPTAGGACVGSGVGPTRIDTVIGVSKAYTTRVGAGPFPTELNDADGDAMSRVGEEFGTTTGRKRRCGWLDAAMLRYSVRVNGLTSIAVTKLDVLDGFKKIRVCSSYTLDGKPVTSYPVDVSSLARVEPVYEEFDGWESSTRGVKLYNDLPEKARAYLARMSELAGVPISIVSVGAERSTTIIHTDPWRTAEERCRSQSR